MKPVTDLKFSPDGALLGLASQDGSVYFHGVVDRYTMRNKVQISSDPDTRCVTRIDFSSNCLVVRANTEGCEIKYVQMPECKLQAHDAAQAALSDQGWATENCVYIPENMGIIEDPSASIRVRSADVAHVAVPSEPQDIRSVVATGLIDGGIRLYAFPCPSDKRSTEGVLYRAHAGSVERVCFTSDSRRLLSVGSDDLTVCQWRVLPFNEV